MKRAILPVFSAISLFLGGCSGGEPESIAPACGDGEVKTAIVSSLGFTRLADDGSAPGFDIDGQVSDGSDAESCFKADLVDAEGRKGVDNQLAVLLPDIEAILGDAVDGLIQGAIQNGDLMILLSLDGAGDMRESKCVDTTFEIGQGTPTIGTDGVIEAYQTFELKPDTEVSEAPSGRIAKSTMEAGPFELALPIAIFDVSFVLHIHQAQMRFAIDEEGKYTGYIGGGVVIQELLDGVQEGAGVDKYIPVMNLVLGGAADLGRDEAENKCKQVSAALSFEAVPAFVRR